MSQLYQGARRVLQPFFLKTKDLRYAFFVFYVHTCTNIVQTIVSKLFEIFFFMNVQLILLAQIKMITQIKKLIEEFDIFFN